MSPGGGSTRLSGGLERPEGRVTGSVHEGNLSLPRYRLLIESKLLVTDFSTGREILLPGTS